MQASIESIHWMWLNLKNSIAGSYLFNPADWWVTEVMSNSSHWVLSNTFLTVGSSFKWSYVHLIYWLLNLKHRLECSYSTQFIFLKNLAKIAHKPSTTCTKRSVSSPCGYLGGLQTSAQFFYHHFQFATLPWSNFLHVTDLQEKLVNWSKKHDLQGIFQRQFKSIPSAPRDNQIDHPWYGLLDNNLQPSICHVSIGAITMKAYEFCLPISCSHLLHRFLHTIKQTLASSTAKMPHYKKRVVNVHHPIFGVGVKVEEDKEQLYFDVTSVSAPIRLQAEKLRMGKSSHQLVFQITSN